MRHLTYIMSLAITLLMVACYPIGEDSSVMGPGEIPKHRGANKAQVPILGIVPSIL